jgi:hypothetical protein
MSREHLAPCQEVYHEPRFSSTTKCISNSSINVGQSVGLRNEIYWYHR